MIATTTDEMPIAISAVTGPLPSSGLPTLGAGLVVVVGSGIIDGDGLLCVASLGLFPTGLDVPLELEC